MLQIPPCRPFPQIYPHQISIKLTSSNYLLWKSQLLPMLRSCGLEDNLSPTTVVPPKLLASGAINPAFQLILFLTGSSPPSQKTCCRRLTALGHSVDDVDLVDFVMAGIGPAYRPFVRAQEAH
ncbi:hypothetical protein Tsubulata_016880 [Turnera subulata]|uniref:Retrotransposon Copia-like N-terminal domain-containing protein n=1 Tax=Turnera subulata TaxID=218843 RepID=A0A9Q0F225_9ROSI|nr:hypothetical protein Tsubulata_016880 [Turnera subulata]